MIKALILDLDNTIFPTKSIGVDTLESFFEVLEINNDKLSVEEFENAKNELWNTPFYSVAKKYGFSKKMINEGFKALSLSTVKLDIKPFEDYRSIRNIKMDKYLVTSGISCVQWNKIKSLGIENDFNEIIIDDPFVSDKGKYGIFIELIKRYDLLPQDILVIGDNPESEIAAAKKLNIFTALIARNQLEIECDSDYIINTFDELSRILDNI